MKATFSNSMRIDRPHRVLDVFPKKAVSSRGTNSIFYKTVLKTLKREI